MALLYLQHACTIVAYSDVHITIGVQLYVPLQTPCQRRVRRVDDRSSPSRTRSEVYTFRSHRFTRHIETVSRRRALSRRRCERPRRVSTTPHPGERSRTTHDVRDKLVRLEAENSQPVLCRIAYPRRTTRASLRVTNREISHTRLHQRRRLSEYV